MGNLAADAQQPGMWHAGRTVSVVKTCIATLCLLGRAGAAARHASRCLGLGSSGWGKAFWIWVRTSYSAHGTLSHCHKTWGPHSAEANQALTVHPNHSLHVWIVA